MAKSDTLLTTREFAQKAGVSAGTVSKWLRQGTINGKKTSGKWSISAAELIKVTQQPGEPHSPAGNPGPRTDAASSKADSAGTSYSIQEFSDMTYLTPWGVQQWLKEGRLKKSEDAGGQLRVDGSNLENPDIKRLLR